MMKHTLKVALCTAEIMKNIVAESSWRTACLVGKQQLGEPLITTDNKELLMVRIADAQHYVAQRLMAFLGQEENDAADEGMLCFVLVFPRLLNALQQSSVATNLCTAIENHVLYTLYNSELGYKQKCDSAINATLMMLANNQ